MERSLSLSLARPGPSSGIPGVPDFPNMLQEFCDLVPHTLSQTSVSVPLSLSSLKLKVKAKREKQKEKQFLSESCVFSKNRKFLFCSGCTISRLFTVGDKFVGLKTSDK